MVFPIKGFYVNLCVLFIVSLPILSVSFNKSVSKKSLMLVMATLKYDSPLLDYNVLPFGS